MSTRSVVPPSSATSKRDKSAGEAQAARVRREPRAGERVARELRNSIIRGELKDGAPLLSEPELMAHFHVSRPTLREGLRILESESLISVKRGAGGGPRVHRPDSSVVARHFGLVLQSKGTTLEDFSAARLAIEPQLARLAAEKSRGNVTALRALIEEERIAIHDDILLSAALLRFNDALAEMTGNQTIALIWSMLNTIARRHSSAVAIFSGDHPGNVGAIRRALKAQSKLTDLIEAGDADGAEAFWRTHVDRTSEIMLRTQRIERVIDVLD
jgi:DNA-binding FadR family transcriptional regulator